MSDAEFDRWFRRLPETAIMRFRVAGAFLRGEIARKTAEGIAGMTGERFDELCACLGGDGRNADAFPVKRDVDFETAGAR